MIEDIKPDEGLCEYIRRVNSGEQEISKVSGIPKEFSNEANKSRESETIRIYGGLEFIEKFNKGLKDSGII